MAELDIVDRLLEDHTEFRALFAQMQTAPTDQLGDLFLPSMRRETERRSGRGFKPTQGSICVTLGR
jgi:hypothetical protein